MREPKLPTYTPQGSPGGQHIAPRPALKTVAAQPARAEPLQAPPLIPAWKAATQFHNANRVKAVVKGPIRCHKCQLRCIDAEHYLEHKCEIRCAINELRTR